MIVDIKQRIKLGEEKMTTWLNQEQFDLKDSLAIESFIEKELGFFSYVGSWITNIITDEQVLSVKKLLETSMKYESIFHADQAKYANRFNSEILEPYKMKFMEFPYELNQRLNLLRANNDPH